jgi:hypothetical protein
MKGQNMSNILNQLPAFRVAKECFLTRKTEIEKILWDVNTDPQNDAKIISETEHVFGIAFRGMLDLLEGMEKKSGVQLVDPQDRKLNWRRMTLAGRMVANG